MIQVEHIAWQVRDPAVVAKWYCDQLGFRVLRKLDQSPFIHFLADSAGRVVVEMYNNPLAPIMDYASMHPVQLHLAFAVSDLNATRDQLLAAGASLAEDTIITPAGDQLMMLRDPWGFVIQLCKRAKPLLG